LREFAFLLLSRTLCAFSRSKYTLELMGNLWGKCWRNCMYLLFPVYWYFVYFHINVLLSFLTQWCGPSIYLSVIQSCHSVLSFCLSFTFESINPEQMILGTSNVAKIFSLARVSDTAVYNLMFILLSQHTYIQQCHLQ